jgi:hypothetical protein
MNMPRRNDGQPFVRDHSVYSNRQRTLVITFPTPSAALAFDMVPDALIENALLTAIAELEWSE